MSHLCGDLTPAASYLTQPTNDYIVLESCIYEISLTLNKPVHLLVLDDLLNHPQQHLYTLPDWIRTNELVRFQIVISGLEECV